MTPELLAKALDALTSGDAAAIEQALKDLLAAAAGSGESADSASSTGDATGGAPDASAMNAVEKAALAALVKATGAAGPAEAIEKLSALTNTVAKLQADADQIEYAQRVELIAELVRLGVELPATAWTGDPKDRKPVARLCAESVADLRTRVALFAGNPPKRLTPPDREEVELTDLEKKLSANMSPVQKARFVAARSAHRSK